MSELSKQELKELKAAVREGLADVDAGRVIPARFALKAIAKKRGIKIPQKKVNKKLLRP